VNRPFDEVFAAAISVVALGRQEFGHMYLRMKSSALFEKGIGQRVCLIGVDYSLITREFRLGKCRGSYHSGGIFGLKSEIHKFEIKVVVLSTDVLAKGKLCQESCVKL